MPIYEFYCEECGALFEEICARAEASVVCPQCGSTRVARTVTMPSPLKKGAFPFKPQGVHPLARKMSNPGAGLQPSCAGCKK